MSRTTAADRARRILSIVPWIAANDGPLLTEVCERFAISQEALAKDLEVVFMVGTPPYTPDTLIVAQIEGDRVWVHLGDYFRRPLRLSPAEVLPLLAAARAQMATGAGADPTGPLARAVAKVEASLGDAGERLEVQMGPASADTLDRLRRAVDERLPVELGYYSFGRDTHSVRRVDPAGLEWAEGWWYLSGYCHQAEAPRVFRVDRIESLEVGEVPFERSGDPGNDAGFSPGADAPRVTLELAPAARWVLDYYPHEEATVRDDGTATVTLAVAALPWLARLLLRLGADASIDAVDAATSATVTEIESLRRSSAARILERYRS